MLSRSSASARHRIQLFNVLLSYAGKYNCCSFTSACQSLTQSFLKKTSRFFLQFSHLLYQLFSLKHEEKNRKTCFAQIF